MGKAKGQTIWSRGYLALTATQFLGAFNDNAFKFVIVLMAAAYVGVERESQFISQATFVFFIPWVLFSTSAGYIADRVSKRTVIFWSKVAELAVMALGAAAFALESPWLVLGTLFLMALQSTFFGPAKYGILPEMLRDGELSKGNGLMQMATMVAILIGTAAGGMLFKTFHVSMMDAAVYGFIVIALIGVVSSLFVANVAAARPGESLGGALSPRVALREFATTWRILYRSRPLFLTALAIAYFWFVGSLLTQNMYTYAWDVSQGAAAGEKVLWFLEARALDRDGVKIILQLVLGAGIGVGSVLAGWLSAGKVELGLVPIGSVGIGAAAMALAFTHGALGASLAALAVLGISGGFYIVPLQAFLQQRSPRRDKGKLIAGSNWFTGCWLLVSAPIFWGLSELLTPAEVSLALGVMTLGVTVYICTVLPEFLLRLIGWMLAHTFYRIRVVGRENIPAEGPVLLVANHVSLADGPLVFTTVDRFVRFLVYTGYTRLPGLRLLARLMRVIPVAATDGPRAIIRALRTAAESLEQGEVVGIFAEGQVSRHGNMLPFRQGFARVLKYVRRGDVTVIPVHLDRMWGSIFSWKGGKIFWKLPRRLHYPVTVSFGAPLEKSVRAAEVRGRVQELGVEAFKLREEQQMPLHVRFIDQALKHPHRPCMADSTGQALTYRQALIRARVLKRLLARRCGGRQGEGGDGPRMLGILLPASVGGALANIAALLLGRVPVNLNFTAGPEALQSAVRQCGIRQVVTSKKFLQKVKLEPPAEAIYLEELLPEVGAWDKIAAALPVFLLPRALARRVLAGRRVGADELATVIFSSGSTGEPKGVMLSHKNIVSNTEAFAEIFHFGPDDCMLGVPPLFHSFGFSGSLWFPITTGIRVAFHPNPLDAAGTGRLCHEHRGTILMSTPTFLRGYLRGVPPEHFASLRAVIVGAEKLPASVAEAFEARYGITPLEGYGCTELSPLVSLNVPDAPGPGGVQIGTKPGTVGHPIPGVAVKTVDPDSGQGTLPGQEGLLLVKGPNVMMGYLGQPERTAEVIRDGWYVTGDIGLIDEDGFIRITDRLARFSKIGGEMVPHGRVEEALHEAAGASDRLFAVVGIPDERKGERLVVLHTRTDRSPDALCRALRERGLPNIYVPAARAFYRIEAFPVLGTGKLDLKRVCDMARELADGREERASLL